MKYDGNNQLFIARFEDGVWKRMRLIRWNCRWHIQGWDSRPTELGIGTPKVAEDRKIAFGYDHIRERKSRVLIDGKSLQPVGTREVSDRVSAQLRAVASSFPARQSPIALGDAADKQRPQACGDSAAFGVGAL